jgi:hypothetical protein
MQQKLLDIFCDVFFDIYKCFTNISQDFENSFSVPFSKTVFVWDGFMDFTHCLKSKILKILKIKITTFQKLALLLSSSEWRGKEKNTYSVGSLRQS